MKLHRISTAVMALLIAVAASAPAGAAKKGDLLPGGNTLAGPGRLTLDDGQNVWLVFGATADLCATVANTGRSGLVDLAIKTGGVVNSRTIGPGETLGVCKAGADKVEVTCTGGSCTLLWRVDLFG